MVSSSIYSCSREKNHKLWSLVQEQTNRTSQPSDPPMTSSISILSIINNKSHTTLNLLPYCTRSAKRNITFQSTKMPEVLKCPKCDANADVTKDGKIAGPLHQKYSCINVCSGKWAHCASCKYPTHHLEEGGNRKRGGEQRAKMQCRQQHLSAQREP